MNVIRYILIILYPICKYSYHTMHLFTVTPQQGRHLSAGLCNLRFLKKYAQINKLTPSDVHKLSPLVPY